MAYVDTEQPFDLPDGRSSHRGVVLMGGLTPDEATPINDMWFLDLYDPLMLYPCDWVRLPDPVFMSGSTPTSLPTWGGSLVFTQSEQLRLVGGYQLRPGGEVAASESLWTASRRELADGTVAFVGQPFKDLSQSWRSKALGSCWREIQNA